MAPRAERERTTGGPRHNRGDFAAFARNCGAHGVRLTDPGKLDGALEEAFAYDGPAMVEVLTDPELI